ncbi:hypothetical protein AV530_004671 [Patagioenas fasciata monilis]|uniref:Uncharacterized protein n=1 Tax=Patagioenas fasciata monilis TaxID=372326 RepID=A0A1V4KHR0_PATFA|nr:hypothetical protein AV530_004671 [Patagioenas fasciata monilis]
MRAKEDFTHLRISAQSITCLVDSNESPGQPRRSGDDAVVETEGTLCLPEAWIQWEQNAFLEAEHLLQKSFQKRTRSPLHDPFGVQSEGVRKQVKNLQNQTR